MKMNVFFASIIICILAPVFAAAQTAMEMTRAEKMKAGWEQRHILQKTQACLDETCGCKEDGFSEMMKKKHSDFPRDRVYHPYEAETRYTPAIPKSQSGSWESIGPEGGWIRDVIQHPTDSNVLYAAPGGSPSRIHKSTDSGNTWAAISQINTGIRCLAADPSSPSVIYAGAVGSIHKSTNGGISWTKNDLYNSDVWIEAIIVDPSNSSIIQACGDGWTGSAWVPAYYKSTDGGVSWTHTFVADNYGIFISMAADPSNAGIIYAGGEYYNGENWQTMVYRSTDGGSTWQDVSPAASGWITDIAVDPGSGKVYAATPGNIYSSTNRGDFWTQNSGWAYGYNIVIDPVNSSVIYAGGHNVVFKSTDGGASWSNYNSGLFGGNCSALLVNRGNANQLFYASSSGFFKSTNSGAGWAFSSSGMLIANVTAVRVVPSNPETVFAAVYNNALYRTTDAAANAGAMAVMWERMPEFYACDNVSDLIIDPLNPDRMVVMEGGG